MAAHASPFVVGGHLLKLAKGFIAMGGVGKQTLEGSTTYELNVGTARVCDQAAESHPYGWHVRHDRHAHTTLLACVHQQRSQWLHV
jgi:hypothetical protein